MKKTGIIILIVILVILALGLTNVMVMVTAGGASILGGFGVVEKTEQNIRKDEKIDLQNIKNIDLQFASSDINIIMTDDTQMRIVEYSNVQLDTDRLFTVSKTEDTVRITEGEFKFRFVFFNWTQIYYEVYLPKSYVENLKIKAASGNIRIDQNMTMKTLEANLSSGKVKMMGKINAEKVELKTISGEINVQEIEAKEISLTCTSGEIQASNLIGDSECSTVSGNIRIEKMKGASNMKSTSGNIKVNDLEVTGDSNISIVSGNISLILNPASNCEIKTKTTSGTTRLPNDSAIMGTAPYHILNLKTTSGNIKVEKI